MTQFLDLQPSSTHYLQIPADPVSDSGQSVQIYGGADRVSCQPCGSTLPVLDTDLYLNTKAIRRSSLQTLTKSNALSDIWGQYCHTVACSTSSDKSVGTVSCLQLSSFLIHSLQSHHIEWQTADWSIAKDWEGSEHGLIYGTPLKCLKQLGSVTTFTQDRRLNIRVLNWRPAKYEADGDTTQWTRCTTWRKLPRFSGVL